ncbi:MAG: class I SAM-dependent methyltransferase [Gallionella sp.]|nr:class I SAM-dependent methyltransferase [Gallionella sp.]
MNNCLVCGASELFEFSKFKEFLRVTSDEQPFRRGGKLFVCDDCGAVQKRVDEQWLAEIEEIYQKYATFKKSGGDEQIVFDQRSGNLRRRSSILMERINEMVSLADHGQVLDIGCGNGVTLKAFSEIFPQWHLFGQEIDGRSKEILGLLAGFKQLFTCTPEIVPGTYALINLIHTLEHFVEPLCVLRGLVPKLELNGLLFVQVCNLDENPFDLLIADHLLHFTPPTLNLLAQKAGYEVVSIATDWIPKEISALFGLASKLNRDDIACASPGLARQRVERHLAWLNQLEATARDALSAFRPCGLFGSTIAATWLGGALGDAIDFFVEEDPSRCGKQLLRKPILHPRDVPEGSCVYLGLAPITARKTYSRLVNSKFQLILPPEYEDNLLC